MKAIAEEWSKANIAKVYDAAAPSYNRVGPSFFLYFGQRLADLADISVGNRVLDVATGTGAVLFPVAALLREHGRVCGIDLSHQMIRRSHDRIRALSVERCDVIVADAEYLPFDDASFDRVLCSFAIFLVRNLQSLFSECHRVLSARGRLGLVYSAGADENWRWYEQLLSEYQPSADLGTERCEATGVERMLEQAGFIDIAARVEVCTLVFSGAAEWWGWVWSHGDRAVLESLAGDRDQFRQRLFEELNRRKGADGLLYRVPASITFGTKK